MDLGWWFSVVLFLVFGWNKDLIANFIDELIHGKDCPALEYIPSKVCEHCGRKTMWYSNGLLVPGNDIKVGWHCAFGCHDLITDEQFDAILQIEQEPISHPDALEYTAPTNPEIPDLVIGSPNAELFYYKSWR